MQYYVPKSSILLAGPATWEISSVCGFRPIKIEYSDYPKSLIRRTNEAYVFSIKYLYSHILLKKFISFIYDRLFCCNHTC